VALLTNTRWKQQKKSNLKHEEGCLRDRKRTARKTKPRHKNSILKQRGRCSVESSHKQRRPSSRYRRRSASNIQEKKSVAKRNQQLNRRKVMREYRGTQEVRSVTRQILEAMLGAKTTNSSISKRKNNKKMHKRREDAWYDRVQQERLIREDKNSTRAEDARDLYRKGRTEGVRTLVAKGKKVEQ